MSVVRLLLRGWLAAAVCLRTTTIGRRPFIAGAAPRVAATLTAVFNRDVVTRQHRCASDESDRVATRTRVVDHGRGREMLTQARPMVCTGHAREHRLRAARGEPSFARNERPRVPGGAWRMSSSAVSTRLRPHTHRGHMIEFASGVFSHSGREATLHSLGVAQARSPHTRHTERPR